VIGTVEPVSDATAAFQVGGKVTSVAVVVGAQVSAGETLASLDSTSLTQSVSSAESSVESDEAKLTEDEDGETSSSTSSSPSSSGGTGSAQETAFISSTSANAGAGEASSPEALPESPTSAQIAQDQAALVADQYTESTDQEKEAADLTQADNVCGTTTTPPTPPSDPASCTAALASASADEQVVSNDQQKVAADEEVLAKALSAEQSSFPTGTTTTTPSNSSGSSNRSSSSGSTGTGTSSSSQKSGAATSTATDSAQQIATDEADIDTAQANLIEAQQSVSAAQLTSPIAGTVASVGIGVGDTVSAHSSTSDIVIIGTHSFEIAGTLTSSQVTSVKVGYSADVAVDGTTGSFNGTVSQVGPVQASTSGYSYPVVVVLPSSVSGLFTGSTADMSIKTSSATNVLAVPTSAVTTDGTRSYVLVMSSGNPVRKVVKVGIIGRIYTQVLSGVKSGNTVVLANLSQAVPASSSTVTAGFGGGGFGGGGAGFGGGGGGGGGFSRGGSGSLGVGG
jgi:HlyD family secretion protein